MTGTVGFDRPVQLAWLDLMASRYADTGDSKQAFYDTRAVVEMTVGGGASHHNATGKTMTVLARIWLRVPDAQRLLRDHAAAQMPLLAPADRLAVHWAMSEVAYPFFLDGAAAAGRLLRLQDEFTFAQFKQRLTESWGARGTMSAASQRLLKTLVSWEVLIPGPDAQYQAMRPHALSREASALVVRARVLAERGRPIVLDDLARLPDLFPFEIADVRRALKSLPDVQLSGSGASSVAVSTGY